MLLSPRSTSTACPSPGADPLVLLTGRSSSGSPEGLSHPSACFTHHIPSVACPNPCCRLHVGFPNSHPPALAAAKASSSGRSKGEGGGGGGPGCPVNTQQLGRFNLHLFNGLVPMGAREIRGLCSKSLFSHHPKPQPWAAGPLGHRLPLVVGKEMPLLPPPHQAALAAHPDPIVTKKLWMS